MKRINKKNINTPKYWDIVYKAELLKGVHRIELERFRKVASMITNGSTVLDVGCGTGEFVDFLCLKKDKCIISGIDFSKVAIIEAKKKCPECDFFVIDIMEMSKTFSDIDYIVSFETIEHLDDPPDFINEVSKTLKKGGILFLSTPYDNKVTGGDEHMYSFDFQDMVDCFEKTNLWSLIIIMRYSANLKNMFVVAKKIVD